MTEAPKSLVIGWRPSSVSGWGVYGQNLIRQLLEKGRNPILYLAPHLLDVSPEVSDLLKPVLKKQAHLEDLLEKVGVLEFDYPVLHALRNDFQPSLAEQPAQGNKNIGVIFFESTEISEEGLARARDYDLIVTGSSWNKEILESRGLTNVANVFQGIDHTVFHPRPRNELYPGRFVIYSGGKLEYRKAQDVVIAAFKEFHANHPDALLTFAWANQWTGIMPTINRSKFTTGQPEISADKEMLIDAWLLENGLAEDSFVNLGMLPNKDFPDQIAAANMAVFPNRCEPGTNLVAMEAMAMGLPCVIAANTGQLDLIAEDNCYPLEDQTPVEPYPPYNEVEGWREPSVKETLQRMEDIYQDQTEAGRRGEKAAAFLANFSWANQIDRLLSQIDALYED
ncbi:MAG: glycosyltransferase family 4 protein [Rhodospirillaceae bacterium]|jgi:glycosyltransferase involved in cell wall biosynthesis|nr:glycosyltransferase family 4 protein [Rhodospirillaceae bacterium]MBT4587675.1 glycosyltransferase family 4 protein [Rhodospirillaceae bacterium]MBT5939194.1 glycosyltransferase family 4 protein [Rhodospirillaceae bacterium]